MFYIDKGLTTIFDSFVLTATSPLSLPYPSSSSKAVTLAVQVDRVSSSKVSLVDSSQTSSYPSTGALVGSMWRSKLISHFCRENTAFLSTDPANDRSTSPNTTREAPNVPYSPFNIAYYQVCGLVPRKGRRRVSTNPMSFRTTLMWIPMSSLSESR